MPPLPQVPPWRVAGLFYFSFTHYCYFEEKAAYTVNKQSSLMMEAARTSETSVDNHFTRQYNPEDSSENQYLVSVRHSCSAVLKYNNCIEHGYPTNGPQGGSGPRS
jgi:hypothetical protein